MRNDTKLDLLWDEVEELKKSGGSDLPDVSSADNGKILGVVNGAWNKMAAPAGGVDYSTTEQNTGRKWIDGKDIYVKTIVKDSSFVSGVDNQLTHGIENIDNVIDYNAIFIETSGYSTTMTQPVASAASATSNVNATYAAYVNFVGKTDCLYTLGSVIVNQLSKLYVTIYYTKTEPTKSKKKTTK